MSVYRQKKSKYYYFDFTWRGRRVYGPTGIKGPKSEAQAIEDSVRTRLARGEYLGIQESMMLETAIKRYRREKAGTYQLDNILRLLGRATLLSEITDARVAEFVARRRGEKNTRYKKLAPRIGPATVNRETELLRRVMNRARDVWGVAVARVNWKLHHLAELERDRPMGEDEEIRIFEEAADHLIPILEFELITGLRRANVVGLDWSQIDLPGRRMMFRMKGGKVHTLPVNDVLLVLLANLGPKPSGPVFTFNGKRIKSIRSAWEGARRRAGVPDLRFHDLRHTVGSRLVARGVDISIVQEYLGHADITTTRRYVHHKQDAKRAAMDALSEKITRLSPYRKRSDGNK